MLDDTLSGCVDRAIERLPGCCHGAPMLGEALAAWATRLSPTGRARDYFDGGRAIIFLLPWWLEKKIRPQPDLAFQERLVEASIHAYYFVRMIDDLMDGDAEHDRALLPALGILHSGFCRGYGRLFAADEVFWRYFDLHWNETMEAAMRDKRLTDVSADDFVRIVGRKTSGIKIPLAAVCCRCARMDLLAPWSAFYDKLACWQQMLDDTVDWMRDLRHGVRTFFLCEAVRQKRGGESVSGWVIRRGAAWALERLKREMRELKAAAAPLGSPELDRFLAYREAELLDYAAGLEPALRDLARAADAFEPIDAEPT